MADDGSAEDAAAAVSVMPAARNSAARTLAVPIRVLSLSRQWDLHRLGLTVRRDAHHQRIALQAAHHSIHHLVSRAEHHALSASVFDQGKLVAHAPDDSHHLDASDVGRRVATYVVADESAVDQRLERITPAERVVLIGDAILEMSA